MELGALLPKTELVPILKLAINLFGALAAFLVIVLLLHTISVLGRASPLYRKRQPVEGWNRRFYPACVGMIILILVTMKLLNIWVSRI